MTDQDNKPSVSPIIAHMEHYLGPISDGWDTTAQGAQLAFPLARFASTPKADWCVLSTLGLSAYPLKQANMDALRQELLTCWPEEVLDDAVPSHLYALADQLYTNGEALGRGALLPLPQEPLLPSGSDRPWAAWYVTLPFFIPEQAILSRDTNPPTLLAWLMPVYEEEADFIFQEGAAAFEERMMDKGLELFEWPRQSLAD